MIWGYHYFWKYPYISFEVWFPIPPVDGSRSEDNIMTSHKELRVFLYLNVMEVSIRCGKNIIICHICLSKYTETSQRNCAWIDYIKAMCICFTKLALFCRHNWLLCQNTIGKDCNSSSSQLTGNFPCINLIKQLQKSCNSSAHAGSIRNHWLSFYP